MDPALVDGLTLAISLWVLGMVHRTHGEVKGVKTDITHRATQAHVAEKITEHARHCRENRRHNGDG